MYITCWRKLFLKENKLMILYGFPFLYFLLSGLLCPAITTLRIRPDFSFFVWKLPFLLCADGNVRKTNSIWSLYGQKSLIAAYLPAVLENVRVERFHQPDLIFFLIVCVWERVCVSVLQVSNFYALYSVVDLTNWCKSREHKVVGPYPSFHCFRLVF